MEQRSPEWFEARKGRITASLVGAILGISPYMTRADAMRVMVREALGAEREFTGNIATQWGENNEDGALIDFRFKTGLDVTKAGFFTYEDWAGASPDRLIGETSGVEVKCPYGLRTSHCPVPFKSLAEQPHYEAQVQFTMFVTGRNEWHFFQWAPNETRNEVVRASQKWVDRYIPILKQFHAEFLDELCGNPAEHLAPKRAEIATPEAFAMAAEWDALKASIAEAQERQRVLLDDMVSMAGGKDALFAGRKLTCVEREGAVSYAAVVNKHCAGVDLEPFRGKASRYWRLG